jgi:type IV pilus assembly protein PilA
VLKVETVSTPHRGVIKVTSRNIPNKVDGSAGGVVTLIPYLADGTSAPTAQSSVGKWICGGTGTDVALKFLPGSCRGV